MNVNNSFGNVLAPALLACSAVRTLLVRWSLGLFALFLFCSFFGFRHCLLLTTLSTEPFSYRRRSFADLFWFGRWYGFSDRAPEDFYDVDDPGRSPFQYGVLD